MPCVWTGSDPTHEEGTGSAGTAWPVSGGVITTSTSQTRIAATSGALLLTLAVFVLLVSIAQAAEPLTQLSRAHGAADVTYVAAGPAGSVTNAGRGGVFARTTPATASTATLIGGAAITALVIALIAFLALGSRASRRGELAPVTSLVQAPSASPAAHYDERERKAA